MAVGIIYPRPSIAGLPWGPEEMKSTITSTKTHQGKLRYLPELLQHTATAFKPTGHLVDPHLPSVEAGSSRSDLVREL